MKTFKLTMLLIMTFAIPVIFESCFHNLQPNEVNIAQDAVDGLEINAASKCQVIDGSVIIFENGFTVKRNKIIGIGERYYFIKKTKSETVLSIPLDSIAAITTYDSYTSGRLIANGSLSFLGTAMSALAVYCLSCPKCCFGSCPTVYTFENDSSYLETELFSSSISRMLENDDLDKLKQKIPEDGIYKIKMTNEAMETHYVDKFNLLLAEHPLGTEIYPNTDNSLTVFSNPETPVTAFNSHGINILNEIKYEDTISYRSGMEMVNELKENPGFDWIEFTSVVPETAFRAKLLVRYRNTLLSTILFYDVVLGSQGIHAVKWIDKMNNDSDYASDFKMIYDNFSGMELEMYDNGIWIPAGKFPDAGPICPKDFAAEVSIKSEMEVRFRLKFIPDNFMIDYIGIEYSNTDDNRIKFQTLVPSEIISNVQNTSDDIYKQLESSDKNYLVTNPGESYTLIYRTEKRNDVEQSFLISSRGYYNEWIRGTWIKNDSTVRRFELYNIRENLRNLAVSWEENKALIESEFFNSRIPLKGKRK